jgi:hypothetical protein
MKASRKRKLLPSANKNLLAVDSSEVKEQSVMLKHVHRSKFGDESNDDEEFTIEFGNFTISHIQAYENDNGFWKNILDPNFIENGEVTIKF